MVGKPKPAVIILQSVKPEYIICLEDGTEHKMLNRHLNGKDGVGPQKEPHLSRFEYSAPGIYQRNAFALKSEPGFEFSKCQVVVHLGCTGIQGLPHTPK